MKQTDLNGLEHSMIYTHHPYTYTYTHISPITSLIMCYNRSLYDIHPSSKWKRIILNDIIIHLQTIREPRCLRNGSDWNCRMRITNNWWRVQSKERSRRPSPNCSQCDVTIWCVDQFEGENTTFMYIVYITSHKH